MLLAPSRYKYRKQHRGRMKGTAQRGSTLAFGEFGLQALEPCWLEARQIEAARIALTRFMKRGGKVWIRVFPDKPITAKPAETRMGSGKGAVDHYVAVVKPGRIIFEIGGERRKQIQEFTYGEAQRELKDLRMRLFNLRLQQQRGEIKNNRVFTQTRKDIARVLHRLTQLEAEE